MQIICPVLIIRSARNELQAEFGFVHVRTSVHRKPKGEILRNWRVAGDFAQQILDRYHPVIGEYVMIEPALKLIGKLTPKLNKSLDEFPRGCQNFPRPLFWLDLYRCSTYIWRGEWWYRLLLAKASKWRVVFRTRFQIKIIWRPLVTSCSLVWTKTLKGESWFPRVIQGCNIP